MAAQTQSVFAETRTFCIKGYYEKGGNIFNPISELEKRNYTSKDRFGALAQAKEDGLVQLASITDVTPKIITKVQGMTIYGN